MSDAAPSTTNKPKRKIARIVVDRELCIGATTCVAFAGKTFVMDGENKATVIVPRGDIDEDVLAAAASCPVNAILLYDEDGKRIEPTAL